MQVGSDYRVPEQNCLCCGKSLDLALCVGEDTNPGPGDITICSECGHVMALADDLSFRELNDKEIKAMAGDKRLLAIQRARVAIMDPPE